ncbi:hypothetical protein HELRODRAFT_177600 [Helobdella robusta]|uniref:SH2 domain-containing protein n=1 Tax=Helobdella robusta TaxID=6412 RepID=T1FBX3_HELRO|nr:hypothetical protein HELRODRAFT_177600 [Helobdella robusta]ESN97936.1 hypothetical protein HELRODRAFT_177600 [Helobdella robusta]
MFLAKLFFPHKRFQIQQKQEMTALTDRSYYFGKISRKRADVILERMGFEDGSFLLRESLSIPENFCLSVSFNGRINCLKFCHLFVCDATEVEGKEKQKKNYKSVFYVARHSVKETRNEYNENRLVLH